MSGPPGAVVAAMMHLRRAGIPAVPWPGRCATTELAKHLSTLRLGIDVLFMRACHDTCRALGVDFALVYREWTRAYNAVYAAEGLARPVLTPVPGPLGGHCVALNAQGLMAMRGMPDSLVSFIGKVLTNADAPWNLSAMTPPSEMPRS